METLSSPTTSSSLPPPIIDDMVSSPHQHFLKMEDLHHPASASPPSSAFDEAAATQSSPPPVIIQSKAAKKRKSWGQELPEPKTNLPPRKRAKTDDEKEQRRIERIKRNRAAAHNSRERKRQETETLAIALARANAEIEAYRTLHGPLPSHIILPEVHVSIDGGQTCTTTPAPVQVHTPAPSLVESYGSHAETSPSPTSSSCALASKSSPKIKPEPIDSPLISMPSAFDNLDSKSSLLSPLDLTQHSAAMLCDLQCRSSGPMSRSIMTSAKASWWSNLFLYLMTLQLQNCYRTLMMALWTISPSRMARLMRASMLRLTSRSTTSSMTPRLSRSTSRRLALYNAATGLSAPRKGALSLEQGGRSGIRRAEERAQAQRTEEALGEQGTGRRKELSKFDEKDENARRSA